MNRQELSDYLGSENISIVEAMQRIDRNRLGILFIIDVSEKLVGAVSDGDIRRWLIKTGNLKSPVREAMNRSPRYLLEEQKSTALSFMKDNMIRVVPVLDSNGHVVDIMRDAAISMLSGPSNALCDIPVVMMAGGMGTRLYPYTKILPKPLIPVGEKPIAEIIIDNFRRYGCNDFRLIVNHKKNMIKAYFNETGHSYSLQYADEEKPLGTGGGLKLLDGKLNSTFILTNCDILVEADYGGILEYHKNEKRLVTMVCSLKSFRIPYGVINLEGNGKIKSMEEKPEFSFFTNTGLYIVEPEVLDEIPENTEIGFPDVIEKLRLSGDSVGVYPVSENSWMDMGQMDSLEDMRRRLEDELQNRK